MMSLGKITEPPGLTDDVDEPMGGLQVPISKGLGEFDPDIIDWMRRDPNYCLKIQKTFESLLTDPNTLTVTVDGLHESNRRKLVHKLCDRYNLKREVNPKKGEMYVTRAEYSVK